LFYYNNPDRPFQLTEVISENRPAQFLTNQTVAYTSFQRPSMINHGDYTAFFTYNASGDRVRMQTEHIKAGELQDRFYIGSRFEVDVIEHSAILWLGGDAYSAPAALKRQFGGTWNIYYICRDYLGSIHVVTDEQGVIVQEISFDPWGRLRNAQTHQLYAIGNEPRLFLGNRGFTGHEHLQWFGLINMNARLYDPLVGRFLSPDPFVQAPGFTQSFNRYSYAWNNPLKFIDPSGEVNYRFCRARGWWFDGNNRGASDSDVFLWMHGVGTGNNFWGMPCSMSNSWGNDLMRFSNFGGSWASVGASSRGVGSGGSWHHLHVHETVQMKNFIQHADGSTSNHFFYTQEVYRGKQWVWLWNNSTADARMGNWRDALHFVGPALILTGQPIIPKPYAALGSGRYTSVASKVCRNIPGKLPFRVLGTRGLGAAIGRFIPGLGWAITFVDMVLTPPKPVQPLPFEPAPVDNTRVVVPTPTATPNIQPW